MATAVTSMRIPSGLNERYSRLAEATGRTKAFYIREALEGSIDRLERKYGAINNVEDAEGLKAHRRDQGESG